MAISYRTNLIVYVTLLVVLTGAALTLFALHNAKAVATATASQSFLQATTAAADESRNYVVRATPLARSLEVLAGNGLQTQDSDALARQLVALMRVNHHYTWISYSDTHGTFTGIHWTDGVKLRVNQSRVVDAASHGSMTEYDVHDDGSWTVARQEAHWDYDPRHRPFYLAAAASRKVSWVGPYVFYDEGIPGVTCADPVFDKAGNLQGVFSVDFDLRTLSEFAARQAVWPDSKLVILTPDGSVLADPAAHVAADAGHGAQGVLPQVSDVGDALAATLFRTMPPSARVSLDQATTRPGAESAISQQFQHWSFQFGGDAYFGAVKPFHVDEGLTWLVVAAAPQSDFLAGAYQDALKIAAVSTASVLAAIIVGVLLARRVSGPILSLVAFMRRVGAGELEAQAQLGGSTEFRELSDALNKMIVRLRDGLRLSHSIAVAQQVQRKLLPAAPPKVYGLDIAGHSTYCDETGGDYYDFLSFDNIPGRIFVVIGDAMGHGIGAALPMAGARAVLRNRAPTGTTLGGLLGELNRVLSNDLQGQSFMTMLVAMVDATATTVHWASAGHDPIIVYDPHKDHFCELEGASMPLGIDDGATYEDYSDNKIRPGQILVLGTDGVWEAGNEQKDQYGKDRLRDVIRASSSLQAADIGAAIKRDVETFRGSAPQTDDITFVVIKILEPTSNPTAPQAKC